MRWVQAYTTKPLLLMFSITFHGQDSSAPHKVPFVFDRVGSSSPRLDATWGLLNILWIIECSTPAWVVPPVIANHGVQLALALRKVSPAGTVLRASGRFLITEIFIFEMSAEPQVSLSGTGTSPVMIGIGFILHSDVTWYMWSFRLVRSLL